MEQIRMKTEGLQKFGIHFLVASVEAIGILFLLAKIFNYTVEQWSVGVTFVLYLLLVILFVLILGKKNWKCSEA